MKFPKQVSKWWKSTNAEKVWITSESQYDKAKSRVRQTERQEGVYSEIRHGYYRNMHYTALSTWIWAPLQPLLQQHSPPRLTWRTSGFFYTSGAARDTWKFLLLRMWAERYHTGAEMSREHGWESTLVALWAEWADWAPLRCHIIGMQRNRHSSAFTSARVPSIPPSALPAFCLGLFLFSPPCTLV